MVLYGEGAWGNGGPSEAAVARETARQWLGLAVSGASAEARRLFEGMPLYLAAMWLDQEGPSRRPLARAMASAADSLPGSGGGRDGWRGAWTLHELRGVVGDSAFAAGLRGLVARFGDSVATTADVAAVMSQAAGRDVEWLFRQDAGAEPPVIDVVARRRGGRWSLALRPADGASLRMPGLRLLVDGKPYRVDLSGPETIVELRGVRRAPGRIELDPQGTWLARLRRAP
jgi:hypothetical protein